MGREIRRVPPNWEHPRTFHAGRGEDFQAMYDGTFLSAWNEWKHDRMMYRIECLIPTFMSIGRDVLKILGFKKWKFHYDKSPQYEWNDFVDYHGDKPDEEYYRPAWKRGEATWFQVYETVSEGTPDTPPFETKEELIQYLMANGDFWDQKRRREHPQESDNQPWTEEQARTFIDSEWAPSAMVVPGAGYVSGVQGLVEMAKEKGNS
jgi:hypothetical protein